MGHRRTAARCAAWAVSALLVGLPLLPAGATAAAPEVRISGDVQGLRPGADGRLVLTLTSPAEAVVTSLSARVTGVSPGCEAGALTVEPWTGRVVVPAGGSVAQPLVLHVSDVAGCDGATWQLAYSAR